MKQRVKTGREARSGTRVILDLPEDGETSMKAQDNGGFDSGMPGQLVTGIAVERAQVLWAGRAPWRC